MQEERYWLDTIRLTFTNNLGSVTLSLKRRWTPYHSGVAHGERWQVGLGYSLDPNCLALEFTPVDKWIMSPCLEGARQVSNWTVVSAYGLNSSLEYSAFLVSP